MRAPGSQFEVQFSPDGRTIVYRTATANSIRDLHWAPVDNPGAAQPWLVSPFSKRSPAISPDGHWLAYTSDESGKEEVYVGAFPGRTGRLQISAAGGTSPRWGTNGGEILYRVGDSLISVAVRTHPAFEILRRSVVFVRSYPQLDVNHANWDVSRDGSRFLFIKAESASPDIVMVLNWPEELRRRAPRPRS